MQRYDWFMVLDQKIAQYKEWHLNGGAMNVQELEESEWWEDLTFYIENVAKP